MDGIDARYKTGKKIRREFLEARRRYVGPSRLLCTH